LLDKLRDDQLEPPGSLLLPFTCELLVSGDDQVATGLACQVTHDARFYVYPLLHGSKDTRGRLDRGWTPEQYEAWLGDAFCAQLL